MTRRTEEQRLYDRQRGTDGLDLFTVQREGSPEVARSEMPGAGQRARREARPGASTSAAKRHVLALLLEAHGPLTRSELAVRAGWPKDSVNGRVAEARALPDDHEDAMFTDGHRGGESLVHLRRLRPAPTDEG